MRVGGRPLQRGVYLRLGGEVLRIRVLGGDLLGLRARGDWPFIDTAGELPQLPADDAPERDVDLFFAERGEVPDRGDPGCGELRLGHRAHTPQLVDGQRMQDVELLRVRDDEHTVWFGQAGADLGVLLAATRAN